MKSKEQKRSEAEKRQQAYNDLSIEEKLAKLPEEPAADRQRQKLMLQLENRDRKPKAKESVGE